MVEQLFNHKRKDMKKFILKNDICKKECDCGIIHKKTVEKTLSNMPEDDILLYMADFYKALSDSTRIKILACLNQNEHCVCDLSSILNMTKSAVSHQLQNLKEMNLIKSRKSGKEVIYSLADRHVEEVFEMGKEHVLEMINEKNS